jgi:2-methylisocitrate lyase-like PEP mutase family enzyme
VKKNKTNTNKNILPKARVDDLQETKKKKKKTLDEAIQRGNAYAEAGGDCIFYLFVHSADIIGRLAKEVKAPISILAGPQAPSVSELQDLGVARVSYGSAFLKAAIGWNQKVGAGDSRKRDYYRSQRGDADA